MLSLDQRIPTQAANPQPADPAQPTTKATPTTVAGFAGLGINLAAMLVGWGSMSARMDASEKRLEGLEAQRSNEVRVIVEQHDKRLDGHDAVLTKLAESSTQVLVQLSRIEQAVKSTPAR
jgi:hypothetical protein